MNDLCEFLSEVQVQQYHQRFVKDLKVTTLAQLRDVEEEDLIGIGMTKPEVVRMRLHLKKKLPHGAFGQLKKLFGKSHGAKVERSQSLCDSHSPTTAVPFGKHAIPKDAVSLSQTLGAGQFGSTVRLGVWTKDDHKQVQVAVKCLPKAKLQKPVSDFLQEVLSLLTVSHANLVPIFGVILDVDNIMLVMEHTPLQSLVECFRDASLRSCLSVRLLCDLAKQVVDAMAYLEQQGIVHGNLAARNVLVISIYKVKISDYGLPCAIGMNNSQQTNCEDLLLILPWCAPECARTFSFTSASDVWSYGVTLWEMFSYGVQPWLELTGHEIVEAVKAPLNRRLPKPKCCPDNWYATMLKCWQVDPLDRPKFSELFVMLTQLSVTRVVATREVLSSNDGCVACKKGNIITVLSKDPGKESPRAGLWLGIIEATNEIGFFDSTNTSPHIDIITSDVNLNRNTKINRSWSLRASLRPSRKLTASMISSPWDDLKHISHIGFDGAVFGDVPLVDGKLSPLAGKKEGDIQSRSSSSLLGSGNSLSVAVKPSLLGNKASSSASCLSSELVSHSKSACDFTDLKLPDLTGDLDFGGSLYDEVMAALNKAIVICEDNTDEVHFSGSVMEKDCYIASPRKNSNDGSSNSTVVAKSSGTDTSEEEEDEEEVIEENKEATGVNENTVSLRVGDDGVNDDDDDDVNDDDSVIDGQQSHQRKNGQSLSSDYGVYSIQNATRNRNALVPADASGRISVEYSSKLESSSQPASIPKASSRVSYMNVPPSVPSRGSATVIETRRHFQQNRVLTQSDSAYLEPRNEPRVPTGNC